MRILWYSTSTNNTVSVVSSLQYLNQHEVKLFHYDQKWNEACAQAIQANPDVRAQLQAGQFHLPKNRVGMDEQMLKEAEEFKPDVMLYTSAWEGDFVPDNSTLGQLNALAPLVHLCWDGADRPWWQQMKAFEEQGVFSLTVTIDGALYWPGGKFWNEDWRIKNAVTVLTPCDPRYFQGVDIPFSVRPFAVGYGGNAGGWIRSHLVSQLGKHKGHVFTFRPRDDFGNSYAAYAQFLRHCKAVISVPFTGSNFTTHVKGRPLEAGWAGAALMEWKNDVTRQWFIPRFEFWEYHSVESCMEETEYLAAHPELCEEMAVNLNRRVTTEHNPARIWGQIFEAAGK